MKRRAALKLIGTAIAAPEAALPRAIAALTVSQFLIENPKWLEKRDFKLRVRHPEQGDMVLCPEQVLFVEDMGDFLRRAADWEIVGKEETK